MNRSRLSGRPALFALIIIGGSLWGLSAAHADCVLNCPAGDGVITVADPAITGDHSPDLNLDGHVTVADFGIFATYWLEAFACADYNCDGIVDVADFSRFAVHYSHIGTFGYCIP
jgi:hypothetical protein